MSLLSVANAAQIYTTRRGLFGRAVSVRAVDGISFDVAPGQTLGVVGESGCGKSTTGRIALGLERPDEGSVTFEGQPMPPPGSAAWRAMRAKMQLVFQDPLGAMDRRLTIAQQIEEPLIIHRIGTESERADRVAKLLVDVGLRTDHGARHPHELSGGQRQRAVLARALATNPSLLVCDEPVSALDVSIQAQVVNMLTDLQAARGIAMVFISHDLKVVRQVSHVVAVMYLGRIVEQGDPEALFAAPVHPYTRALVSAIPVPGPRRIPRIVLTGDPPNPANRPSGCAFHPRCPVAVARCQRDVPAMRQFADGRKIACHLVEDATESLVAC